MEPRISFVTLGATDFDRSLAFYTGVLGLERANDHDDFAMFQMGQTVLALYPRHLLAADAGLPDDRPGGGGFAGFALAHNVKTRDGVDALLAEVEAAGATVTKPAADADWGGRSGYFVDPDGFLWEIAWNPHLPNV
ncbi:MAG TPA: VOC family protein [Thermoanaerobaculia bacterium]|nr:VOC family protein [Thermoanaerobaculia bacterium]